MTVSNLFAQVSERRACLFGDDFKLVAAKLGNEILDVHGVIFARRKDVVKSNLCGASIQDQRNGGFNGPMDRYRYRRQWLRKLKDDAGSVSALAEKIGTDPNYLSSLLGPSSKRNIGDDIIHRTEDAFKFPRGTMDLPSAAALLIVQEASGMSEAELQEVVAYMRFKKSSKN